MAGRKALVGARGHAGLVSLGTAIALHGAAVLTLASLGRGALLHRPAPALEVDVVEKPAPPPPPPEVKSLPVVPPPVSPPRPIPVLRVATRRTLPQPPSPPPPPNREVPPAPPVAAPAPAPTFGVTPESVVPGDSPVAVPVGNTLMTKDRAPAKGPLAPLPPAAPPMDVFAPAAESSLCELAVVSNEIKPEYPIEANRLGLEGRVTLRVGVDRQGKVRSVRVTKPAGNGMDTAAVQAMWKFSFKPARTCDGRAVDSTIAYTHTFQLQR